MITSTTVALLVSGTIEVQTLSFSSVAVTNAPFIEMLEPTDDDSNVITDDDDEDTGDGDGKGDDGDTGDGKGDNN